MSAIYFVHFGKLHSFLLILGLEAWASGDLEDFGRLVTASGRSSIENYECGN